MRLNPAVKKLWQEALISGKYGQGRFNLRKDGSFCCLGVLCDIAPMGEWGEELEGQPVEFVANDEYPHVRKELPPAVVRQWAGLTLMQCQELTTLNDDEGKDFREIAAYIKVHL